MGRKAKTIPAQSRGLEVKKTSGRGGGVFLDFSFYRTSQDLGQDADIFSICSNAGCSGRGRGLNGGGARLALRRYPVASRGDLRAQDELALETARLETAVRLGDLIEGDPLGNARPDDASCQQDEEPLQVLPEPGGMSRPHHVDRVDAGALADRQRLP